MCALRLTAGVVEVVGLGEEDADGSDGALARRVRSRRGGGRALKCRS